MAVQVVPGSRAVDAVGLNGAAIVHRYSVDELHALARLHGRNVFPGVPDDTEPLRSPREHAIVTDVIMRTLVARGVIHTEHRITVSPFDLPIDVVLSPELTCSVQRYRHGTVDAHNAFVRYGLLVEQASPAEGVIDLVTSDVRTFGSWLASATGWSPQPAMRTELRRATRTVRTLRGVFNQLAQDEASSLDDERVLDAGHVVISRQRGTTVDGVDLGWISTERNRWVFTHATDVLFGFGRGSQTEVTMQAATDAELTRAILRAVRPVALSSVRAEQGGSV